MKRKTDPFADNASAHITPAGGNVFADLAFSRTEAKALQAHLYEVIAKKVIKKQLMDSLADWMVQQKLIQAKAASLLGLSRSRVSDAIRHKNSNFTVGLLIDMVVRTGPPTQIAL